jgi:hypothetical protein
MKKKFPNQTRNYLICPLGKGLGSENEKYYPSKYSADNFF